MNFFEAKQKVMNSLFTEISTKLRMPLDRFLQLKFVDPKNMLIKGNKRSQLYIYCEDFKAQYEYFLNNVLKATY